MTRSQSACRLAVYGTGYLGATHAACMAELGHEVIGVDIDPQKVRALSNGTAPFYEPDLDPILKANVENGRLRFSSSYEEAADFAEAHFIAVATPQKSGEFAADLRYVDAVVRTLVPLINENAVIFGKSTVPVGTAARLSVIADALARPGVTVEIAWNPEFLREGHAVRDTLQPDRIVLGVAGDDSGAEAVARKIYEAPLAAGVPLLTMDRETAELVKVSANAFLATKISFINAMAEVCDVSDADVTVLADALGLDERIGRRFLNAGIGFGGGCLPKDIRAFMAMAGAKGAQQAFSLLREVDSINMRRRNHTVELVREALGGSLIGARVAVLGAAFKPQSDDVRDSPALNIAGQLQLQGASVVVFDPKAMDGARMVFPTLDYARSTIDACQGADIVLILTEWDDFLKLDPNELAIVVRARRILDGRNCLRPDDWKAHGWTYVGVGRR